MDLGLPPRVAPEQSRVCVVAATEALSLDEGEAPASLDEEENCPATDETEPPSVSDVARAEDNEFAVLVVVHPEKVRHRVLVTAQTTVDQLRTVLCTDFQLPPASVTFPDICDNETSVPLAKLGIRAECTLNAMVVTRAGTNASVMPEPWQVPVYPRTPVLTVAIDKFTGRKAYLGGYNHRQTGQHYHHASTQTEFVPLPGSIIPPRAHRETQTHVLVTRSLQTHREAGTQMARRGLILDESFDRLVAARLYVDSDHLKRRQEAAVLLLQRIWRGHLARRFVFRRFQERRQDHELQTIEKRANQVENLNRHRREVIRRMHPNSVNDFERLLNEVAKWRQAESHKVTQQTHVSVAEKQRALDAILSKETKLLQTIDRLKLTATDATRKARLDAMMELMARPKQWQMSDGGIKEVQTPFTVRAKELMDLYQGVRTPLRSVDERLDMLLHVKWTVQEFDCALTRELVELIDREADLLSRGRKEKSLEGLRKRLTNLFLQFIETPEFNPEATALKLHPRA